MKSKFRQKFFIFIVLFLAVGLDRLQAADTSFSLGLQSGLGEQYAAANKAKSVHYGAEVRYAFNSFFLAHFEFDWALLNERHRTQFDPIGGVAFRIPFGNGHSFQFGTGLDALYAAIIGLFVAAVLEGDNPRAGDNLGDTLTHAEFAGSRRLYFQTSYRYRFNDKVGVFIKGRYLERDTGARGYQSAGSVFAGAEFFLF